jgi:hypothetical protein
MNTRERKDRVFEIEENKKMKEISSQLSIVILSMNGLNSPIKRHRLRLRCGTSDRVPALQVLVLQASALQV